VGNVRDQNDRCKNPVGFSPANFRNHLPLRDAEKCVKSCSKYRNIKRCCQVFFQLITRFVVIYEAIALFENWRRHRRGGITIAHEQSLTLVYYGGILNTTAHFLMTLLDPPRPSGMKIGKEGTFVKVLHAVSWPCVLGVTQVLKGADSSGACPVFRNTAFLGGTNILVCPLRSERNARLPLLCLLRRAGLTYLGVHRGSRLSRTGTERTSQTIAPQAMNHRGRGASRRASLKV